MSPSDSLPARRPFAFGLWASPSPDVGRRVGSLLFRVRLSLRALLHTPGASCTLPVMTVTTFSPHAVTTIHAVLSGTVCCLRRGM